MLNISCPRTELSDMVQVVARGVTGRSSLPILNNIRLEASGETLRMLATDMEHIIVEGTVSAQVVEAGAVTIEARLLTDVAVGFNNGDALVKMEVLANNSIKISCGEAAYAINILPADEYPTPPMIGEAVAFEAPQGLLQEALEQTVFATSKDETRPILTGALLHVTPEMIEMVATDTYRLALRRVSLQTSVSDSRQVIVSSKALNELVRILNKGSADPAKVLISDRQIEFQVGNIRLGSRLIEGEFPKYEKVIPVNHEKEIVCAVKELQSALRRVLVVARDDNNRVVLRCADNEIQLTAQSSDVGNAEEKLPATLNGPAAEVAFNARYVLDMLDVSRAERIVMRLSGPLNPGTLSPEGREDYTYVLMPMQIM